jgi:pyruvyltransferase
VKLIDVRGGVNEFVDDLLSCEVIASSSLHGLVAPDSYGIPSVWIRISDRVQGSDCKLDANSLSTGTRLRESVTVTREPMVQELMADDDLSRPSIDLDCLLAVYPFRRE